MSELQLQQLAVARKACRVCMNAYPGEIRNGAEFSFDPDVMSHWSQWLGDRSPKLVIVGQDFGDLSYFHQFQGRDSPTSPTNLNLYSLLKEAGFSPKPPPIPDQNSGVFLTNSLLCFKSPKKDSRPELLTKAMSSPVRAQWSKNCTELHLRPLLGLLQPKVVLAMGGPAWVSVRKLLRLSSSPEGIKSAAGHHWNKSAFEVFAMGHCSGLGLANRNWKTQVADWQRLGNFLGHG